VFGFPPSWTNPSSDPSTPWVYLSLDEHVRINAGGLCGPLDLFQSVDLVHWTLVGTVTNFGLTENSWVLPNETPQAFFKVARR
jgi:hypothetical protein